MVLVPVLLVVVMVLVVTSVMVVMVVTDVLSGLGGGGKRIAGFPSIEFLALASPVLPSCPSCNGIDKGMVFPSGCKIPDPYSSVSNLYRIIDPRPQSSLSP